MPHLTQWSQHTWILFHSFIPLAVHQLCFSSTDHKELSRLSVFAIYFTAYSLITFREAHVLRRLARMYGYLDGDVRRRDRVSEFGKGAAFGSLFKSAASRISLTIFLTYDPIKSPAEALSKWSWWLYLIIEIGLYALALDFWFYWYHRAMHEIKFLWKYHRTHHLTKHPNASLAAYADNMQKFVDMIIVPFMTYATLKAVGLPMGFYEWWICHQYVVYTELWGHSGVRVHWTPPSPLSSVLQKFHAEMVVEDHDLHHRHGWRASYNYGKQSRLWDRVFGTCGERIESVVVNIDHTNQAYMPIV
ncbi:hypothetical protein ACHAPJ_009679 [Fusarium lateritium]